MVFKDGSLATYNKAKKLGIHIVSTTWIESCKSEGHKVDEALFPTVSKERYDSPGLFPRIRKAKSMQPKTDEEIHKKIEAQLRKKNRQAAKKAEEEKAKKGPLLPTFREPIDLDKRRKSIADSSNNRRDSLQNVLDEMREAGR